MKCAEKVLYCAVHSETSYTLYVTGVLQSYHSGVVPLFQLFITIVPPLCVATFYERFQMYVTVHRLL